MFGCLLHCFKNVLMLCSGQVSLGQDWLTKHKKASATMKGIRKVKRTLA